MLITYRKSLLSDWSDLDRIVTKNGKEIHNVLFSKDKSTNLRYIVSGASSTDFENQLYTIEIDHIIIGFIQFYGYNQDDSYVLMGYILDKKYQGKGLLLSLCKELISKYFGSGKIEKIFTIISSKNEYSIKFIEKLKFKLEKRKYYFDIISWLFNKKVFIYSLSKIDFLNLKT